ncbi:hypothetical protein [Variovorax sp. tm]|uniref:hypothetical protein n=1 Tax=Variovorax atrisoli TaxID=3394203 RepID=UPI003A7FF284
MDGNYFTHDGKVGLWAYTVYLIKSEDDAFCAVADVALEGQHRCKLVLSRPRTTRAAGVEALKRKCIEWIEKAEAELPLRP